MIILNRFLEKNIIAVMHFLTNVVVGVLICAPFQVLMSLQQLQADETEAEEFLGSSYDEVDSIVLHRFFSQTANKVGTKLLSFSPRSHDSESSIQSRRQAWNNLCSTLVAIGKPITIPSPLPLGSNEHPAYLEFMYRNDHRNVDQMRELFFLTPTSKVN